MSTLARIRHTLALATFALWWGGFTFYALAVIPTAHNILHSHVRVGFITQQVTHWINIAAVVALAFLLWELLGSARFTARRRRWCWGAWLTIITMQTGLFLLHPMLDRLLDFAAREILDEPRFYFLHRLYLGLSTGQWLAAWIIWISLAGTTRLDDEPALPNPCLKPVQRRRD